MRSGEFGLFPDGVACPESAEQIRELLAQGRRMAGSMGAWRMPEECSGGVRIVSKSYTLPHETSSSSGRAGHDHRRHDHRQ
jgi:hypothetical protein